MHQQLMKVYLNKMWCPFTNEAAENLGLPKGSYLVLDSFSAYKTDKFNDALKEASKKYTLIPGGCTSKVQLLDVSIDKPFKSMLA